MYHLLNMVIFQCHVSFQGGIPLCAYPVHPYRLVDEKTSTKKMRGEILLLLQKSGEPLEVGRLFLIIFQKGFENTIPETNNWWKFPFGGF